MHHRPRGSPREHRIGFSGDHPARPEAEPWMSADVKRETGGQGATGRRDGSWSTLQSTRRVMGGRVVLILTLEAS